MLHIKNNNKIHFKSPAIKIIQQKTYKTCQVDNLKFCRGGKLSGTKRHAAPSLITTAGVQILQQPFLLAGAA